MRAPLHGYTALYFGIMESSSSDSDAELFSLLSVAASTVALIANESDTKMVKHRGGSTPGRRTNRDLDVAAMCDRLDKDFFCRYHDRSPTFTESEFERTFRMPREVYEKLRTDIMAHDKFFCQLPDATGKIGATTDLNIIYRYPNDCRRSNSIFASTRSSPI